MNARYDLIRKCVPDVSEAEREAYAELAKLARVWERRDLLCYRERKMLEKVLKECFDKSFI